MWIYAIAAAALLALGAGGGWYVSDMIHAHTIAEQAERIGVLRGDRDRETARADNNAAAVAEIRAQCEAAGRAVDELGAAAEALRRRHDEERRRLDASPDDPAALDRLFGVQPPRAGGPEAPRDGAGGAPADPGAAAAPGRGP